MQKFTNNSQAGFTLIECLAYIFMFGMIMHVLMTLFSNSTQLSALNALSLERGTSVAEIEHTFTKAVRPAFDVIDGIGDFRSNDNLIVLALPPKNGHPRFTVIGAVSDANHFTIYQLIEKEGQLEPLSIKTQRMAVDDMRFDLSEGLIQLEFRIQRDPDESKQPGMLHRAVATPRGKLIAKGASS